MVRWQCVMHGTGTVFCCWSSPVVAPGTFWPLGTLQLILQYQDLVSWLNPTSSVREELLCGFYRVGDVLENEMAVTLR